MVGLLVWKGFKKKAVVMCPQMPSLSKRACIKGAMQSEGVKCGKTALWLQYNAYASGGNYTHFENTLKHGQENRQINAITAPLFVCFVAFFIILVLFKYEIFIFSESARLRKEVLKGKGSNVNIFY